MAFDDLRSGIGSRADTLLAVRSVGPFHALSHAHTVMGLRIWPLLADELASSMLCNRHTTAEAVLGLKSWCLVRQWRSGSCYTLSGAINDSAIHIALLPMENPPTPSSVGSRWPMGAVALSKVAVCRFLRSNSNNVS